MAFVQHFQALSTGHANSMERSIMEGNTVLHEREGEILTSPTGELNVFSCGCPCPALVWNTFKAAELSGQCD